MTRALASARVSELLDLERRALERWGSLYAEDPWTRAHFLRDLPAKWELSVLLMTPAERLAAFWISSMWGPGYVHFHRSVIAEPFRGQGLYERIGLEQMARASARGAVRMSAVFNIENRPVRRFYEKHGFRQVRGSGLEQFLIETGRGTEGLEGDVLVRKDGTRKVWMLWEL